MEQTYTPPPIDGYRKLTQREVDLINEIKRKGSECGGLCAQLKALSTTPIDDEGKIKLDGRWVSIGTTHLQEGFMALVRAVDQPTNF